MLCCTNQYVYSMMSQTFKYSKPEIWNFDKLLESPSIWLDFIHVFRVFRANSLVTWNIWFHLLLQRETIWFDQHPLLMLYSSALPCIVCQPDSICSSILFLWCRVRTFNFFSKPELIYSDSYLYLKACHRSSLYNTVWLLYLVIHTWRSSHSIYYVVCRLCANNWLILLALGDAFIHLLSHIAFSGSAAPLAKVRKKIPGWQSE